MQMRLSLPNSVPRFSVMVKRITWMPPGEARAPSSIWYASSPVVPTDVWGTSEERAKVRSPM